MELQKMRFDPNSTLRASKGRISLEDYLHFLRSHKQIDLTVNFLHQIVSIHGFKKLYYPKKVLIEAVNEIDLIDLSRSTVNDDVSSHVAVTLEDVISDLNALDWQECCVKSIQTLNSCKEKPPVQDPIIKKRKLNSQIMTKLKALYEIEKVYDEALTPQSCRSVISQKQSPAPPPRKDDTVSNQDSSRTVNHRPNRPVFTPLRSLEQ